MSHWTWKAGFLAFIWAMCVSVLLGQEPMNQDQDLDRDRARDAVADRMALFERAVNEDAPDLLAPEIDPAFSAVMLTGEPVASFEGLQAYWKNLRGRLGEEGTYETSRTIEDIRFEVGDGGRGVAIVRGLASDRVAAERGSGYEFDHRFTAVLVERESGWKFLRIQETMNPVENVFVDTYRRKAMIWSAVFVGLLGLGLGFALGFYFRRRQG